MRLALAALIVSPAIALADFTGRVVKVADGDTLTVLVQKQQIRVRLDGIDAPERGQPFGKRSRQSLADMCAGKQAHVEDRGKDRYGRTIGRVSCAGIDANSEQVRRGMAWVFDRYVKPSSPLYALQSEAKGVTWPLGRPAPHGALGVAPSEETSRSGRAKVGLPSLGSAAAFSSNNISTSLKNTTVGGLLLPATQYSRTRRSRDNSLASLSKPPSS